MRSKLFRSLAAFTVFLSTIVVFPTFHPAYADTPWSPVFSTNAPGDIKFVSNTVATCTTGANDCANVQAGNVTSSNNAIGGNMILIDVDSDPTTDTSSTATYTLPAGGDILWAGLYWAGYYTGPNGDKDDVKFSTPASGGYVNLTASFFDDWNSNDNYYTGFVDVTALVQAGGTGTYGVADVAVTPGSGASFGGWSLIIVEEDPAQPWKNMTINQGFELVGGSNVVNIPISGFTAPPVGPVNAEVGIFATEGDSRFTGDYAELNGTRLSNGANPSTNFFNSSLSDNGVYNSGGNPNYPAGTLGFDADIVDASGLINPGDTTATVTIGTNGDGFFPTAVTTAIEIFVPNLTTSFEKSVTDLNGEDVHPGDVLEYTLLFENTGEDPSIETMVSDSIPAGTTYVANSLQVIQDDSPAGSRTDAAGDDTAWLDGSVVNFNLGAGANATQGGQVDPISQGGLTYEVSYQVTVDNGTEGTDITNEATIDYIAQFINEPFTATSNEVVSPSEALVDLTLTKTDVSDPIFSGDTVTYTLTASNAGPSTAQNVVISDPLPANTTFNAGASDPNCSESGGTVTCTFASINSSANASATVALDTAGDITTADICNAASVTSDTHEHVTSNNAATECTEIERSADISVTKSAPATTTAGGQLVYTIEVANAGPSDAQSVNVLDAIPAGTTLVSAIATGGGTCSGTTTCSWGEVEAGQSETVTVTVNVPANTPVGTMLTNNASASSADPDPNATNDADSATTEVVASADLGVTKSTNTATIIAGGQVSYDVSVENFGPSDAQNVQITDTIPAGLTFNAAASTPGCTAGGGSVTCPVGTLADGATASATLVFDVPSSVAAGTNISNTASANSTTADPNGTNDSDSTLDAVSASADLSIIKDDGTTTVDAGDQITYQLFYNNNGPSDATGVVITDVIPAGATFDSSASCTAIGANITCTIGNVAAGTGGSITYTVDTDPGLADNSSLLNSASISGDQPDPAPTNDTSFVTTDVNRLSNLIIEKDDLNDPVVAGTDVTYQIEVTNLGPSIDNNIEITDVLPAGLTFVSTDDPANCSNVGQTVTCDVTTLNPGSNYVVEITATTASNLVDGTILSNTATVSGDFSSLVDDTEETTISTSADVEVTKAAPATITAGGQVTYTVTVDNNGPSDAQNVVISDALAAGLTFSSAVVTTGTASCGHASGLVTCTTTSLANGGTIVVEITADIDSSLADGASISNTASATSDTIDPTGANNSSTTNSDVVRSADIEVRKTTLTPVVTAGQTATFELEVTNNGPSDADGVAITDTLPAGFTFDAGASDATCVAGITCSIGTVTAGQTVSITVSATVDSSTAANTYTNSASASSDEPDPIPGNDEDTSDIDVITSADLEITKTATSTQFVPGTTGTYSIVVTNNGPSDATSVVVSDTLPTGTSFNAGGSDLACSAGVTCNLGTIAAGDSVSLTLAIDVDDDVTGTISNTASVSSATSDPTPDNNSNDDDTPAVPTSDLSLSKTAPATATAGTDITYTFVARNDGPSVSTSTVVTDTLPAGLTFDSGASDAACSAAGQVVTCNLGTLAVGQVVNFIVVADLDSNISNGTDIANSASIASDSTDPDLSDNSSVADTEVVRSADIEVTKTADPTTLNAGESTEFTITVTNNGPSDAQNVVIADLLPAGMTATAVDSGPVTCGNSGSSVGCSLATMTAGQIVVITVDADIAANVADGSLLTNSASASSDDPDPDPDNNSDAQPITVDTSADLTISKGASTTDVVAGETLTFTIDVENTGPSDAQNVVVTDTLPASLTIDSVNAPNFSCSVLGQVVTCTEATFADGATETITIETTVSPNAVDGSVITNNAAITSDTTDPDSDDNTASVSTDVDKEIDLSVTKSDSGTTVSAGTSVAYTIEVNNAGPSSATGVVVTDNLPAGTVFNSTLSDSSCSAVGLVVTCNLSDIAPLGDVTFNIVADLPTNFTDEVTITNNVSIVANENDIDTDNNSDSEQTDVQNEADLQIIKDADSAVVAGESYEWDIQVSNAGPADALNVVVTDALPAGTAFDAANSAAFCSESGGVVTCTLGTLVDGAVQNFVIALDVDSSVADAATLANTASVSSSTDDPDTDNNESTDQANVSRDSALTITKDDVSDPVIAGENVEWQITLSNAGPSDAANATIVDVLPAGVTFVSVSNTTDCSFATGTVTCTYASIAAGASENITIIATVDEDFAHNTTLTNLATGNSDSSVGVQATEDTQINRSSDLSITKVSDGAAIAGTSQTFTLTVTNNGPSQADNTTVTDFLPAGFDYVSATIGGCADSMGTVTCDLGNLSSGQLVTFDIVVDVTDSASTSSTNSVSVTSDSPDPDTDNNSASDEVTVDFQADLDVTKTLVSTPVVPGTDVAWEISVTNNGPSIATGVVATDVLPPAFAFLPGTSSAACSISGQNVTCNHASLASGATIVFTIDTSVDASATGNFTNAATATSDIDDPDPGNNDSAVTDTFAPSADLSLAKTAVSSTAIAGETVSYNLEVTNSGPSDAVAVLAEDTLPAGLTFNSASSSASCSATGQDVDCTLPTLPAGQSVTFVITADIDASLADGSMITNNATVGSSTPDPDTDNNDSSDDVDIETEADLGLVKTGPSETVDAGEQYSYTLVVSNDGPSDAQNVNLADTLPPNTAFVSVDNGSCTHSAGTVNCAFGTLAAGDSITIVITVDSESSIPVGTLVSNTASVSSDTTDPNSSNDSGTAGTTISRTASLEMTKVGPSTPAVAGTQFDYELTIENNGPSDSDNAQIIDQLPTGTTYVSGPANCSVSGDTVTCNFGTLSPGQSETVTITVFLGPGVPDMANLVNVATAVGDDSPDAIETEETSVATIADLSLNKALLTDLTAGENATYELIVVNTGPSDAQNVVITDALPAGMTYVTDDYGCSAIGALVTCDVGTVAVGASVVIELTTFVEPWVGAGTDLTNNASITSDTDDPDATNNTSSVSELTDAISDLEISKSLGGDAVVAGVTNTYEIVVTNNGPSDAQDVFVTDTLPTGLTLSTAGSDSRCTGSDTVVCDLGVVTSGTTQTITIEVLASPDLDGSVSNTVEITGTTPDPTPDNNSATDESDSERLTELVVEKTLATETLVPNAENEWIITVTNNGPATASDVDITDVLPEGLEFSSFESAASGVDCDSFGAGVNCSIESIAVGEVVAISIFTLATPEASVDSLTNTVVVSSPNSADPVTDTEEVEVKKFNAALAVTKTGTDQNVERGEVFDWTITVANDGPEDILTPLTIEDPLPEGVEFIALTAPDAASCTELNGVITCEVDSLANGEQIEVVVTNRALTEGTLQNTVTVEAAHVAGVSGETDVLATQQVLPADTFGLAFTGSELARIVMLGGAIAAIGMFLVLASHRRRRITA